MTDNASEVRRLRATLGLSQKAFAKKLGISAASVAHFENRSRRPDAATAAILCRAAHEAGRDDLADVFAVKVPGVAEGLFVPVWRLPKEQQPEAATIFEEGPPRSRMAESYRSMDHGRRPEHAAPPAKAGHVSVTDERTGKVTYYRIVHEKPADPKK
jgi:transcriptional regulator with XRE-family HTH domain